MGALTTLSIKHTFSGPVSVSRDFKVLVLLILQEAKRQEFVLLGSTQQEKQEDLLPS